MEQQIGPNSEEQRQKRVEFRIELEFEHINDELKDVMDVELLRISENSMMRSYNDIKDADYTSAHIKAGRKIMVAMKRLIETKRTRQQEALVQDLS